HRHADQSERDGAAPDRSCHTWRVTRQPPKGCPNPVWEPPPQRSCESDLLGPYLEAGRPERLLERDPPEVGKPPSIDGRPRVIGEAGPQRLRASGRTRHCIRRRLVIYRDRNPRIRGAQGGPIFGSYGFTSRSRPVSTS